MSAERNTRQRRTIRDVVERAGITCDGGIIQVDDILVLTDWPDGKDSL